jgi:hypothetical protein
MVAVADIIAIDRAITVVGRKRRSTSSTSERAS